MEQFLFTLLFVLPGLIGYYWITMLGITPPQKHNSFEILSISILLWLPVTFFNICLYNLFILFTKQIKNYDFIFQLDQIKILSNNFAFQLSYIAMSILTSFIVALLITGNRQNWFRIQINNIRKKRGLSEFSERTTVWDEFFVPYGSRVVEISKIDNPDKKIIGCQRKASRPLELEHSLVLDDIEFFTDLVENNNIPVIKVFFDTKSGIMIKLFDPEAIRNAQE